MRSLTEPHHVLFPVRVSQTGSCLNRLHCILPGKTRIFGQDVINMWKRELWELKLCYFTLRSVNGLQRKCTSVNENNLWSWLVATQHKEVLNTLVSYFLKSLFKDIVLFYNVQHYGNAFHINSLKNNKKMERVHCLTSSVSL